VIEPALPLQAALRSLLAGDGNVTALVAANSILDANQRPSVMPAILLGEGQTVQDEGLARDRFDVYLDVHVWTEEAGTAVAKQIVGAIRNALYDWRPEASGIAIADLYVQSTRFMRDPDTIHAHAVMTLSARVRATA
jgi:hypothetical protein